MGNSYAGHNNGLTSFVGFAPTSFNRDIIVTTPACFAGGAHA